MNLKKNLLPLMAILLTGPACNRDSDNTVTKNFSLSGFNKVTACDNYEIIISSGNSYSVSAKGSVDDITALRAEVVNDQLKIDYPKCEKERGLVHIYITMPSISSFDFSGTSYGTVSGFQMAGIIASLSGASKFKLESEVNELTVFLSGSSILTAKGTAERLKGEVSGEAEYKGYSVSGTDEAFLKTSGQAKAYLNVHQVFEVEASGQSRVYYRGGPIAKNICESGKVKVQAE